MSASELGKSELDQRVTSMSISYSCDTVVLQDIIEENWVKGTWDLAILLITACDSIIICNGKNENFLMDWCITTFSLMPLPSPRKYSRTACWRRRDTTFTLVTPAKTTADSQPFPSHMSYSGKSAEGNASSPRHACN